jgi:hypothetical protein
LKKFIFLLIGIVLVFGLDVKDAKEAEQKCNNGDMESCLVAAEIYDIDLKNYKKAVSLYEKACKYDNSILGLEACNNLGVMYYKGVGVTQDYKKAVELYKKVCDGGDMRGCFNLGTAYYFGRGVAKNYYKAYEYWQKAAKNGNRKAQHNLDILCSNHPWACK